MCDYCFVKVLPSDDMFGGERGRSHFGGILSSIGSRVLVRPGGLTLENILLDAVHILLICNTL